MFRDFTDKSIHALLRHTETRIDLLLFLPRTLLWAYRIANVLSVLILIFCCCGQYSPTVETITYRLETTHLHRLLFELCCCWAQTGHTVIPRSQIPASSAFQKCLKCAEARETLEGLVEQEKCLKHNADYVFHSPAAVASSS